MTLPPPLPIHKGIKKKYHSTYKLEDFIGKDDEYILDCNENTLLVSYETLVNNVELLKRILELRKNKCRIFKINCLDYESALLIEQEIEEDVIIALIDDYVNKDRSYIDTTKFKKHKFYIPLSYFMWEGKFDESCNVYCMRIGNFYDMFSANGDEKLYRETLLRVKEIISIIKNSVQSSELTDLDKCILVSNYLQSKVQYVEDGFKSYADKVYVVEADASEVTREKVGSVNTVLNENYGLCMAIANATTLLLNNPIMNVNVRSLYGDNHVWNIVTIDGKQYYIDNTWLITRNKHRVEEALKATRFNDEYLLIGSERAEKIGHHVTTCHINGEVEQKDFDREVIKESVMRLTKKNMQTNYPSTLRFKSRIEE